MPMLFEDWQRILSPKWLRDGAGDFWMRAFGAQKDRAEQWIRDFMLSRFPDFAAVDALQALSNERGLERPYGQDVYSVLPAWRAKLKNSMERWDHGGTNYGVLRELRSSLLGPDALGGQLQLFDATNALINFMGDDGDAPFTGFSQAPEDSTEANPPYALTFDGAHRWNTFIVLMFISGAHPWHGGPPGDDSNEANQARRIIQRWRAGHAECRRIVVQDSGSDGTVDVLWGVSDGNGESNGLGPVWGGFNWGQRGAAGASTTYWTPPSPQ